MQPFETMHNAAVFVLVALCLVTLIHAGPSCYSCPKVYSVTDCNTVLPCTDREQCHTQKLIDSRANTYYKLGCMDKQLCTGAPIIGKRASILHDVTMTSSEDYAIYAKCCDGSFCNVNHTLANGQWGEWQAWQTCSVTCGTGGTRHRVRTCNYATNAPKGHPCVGSSTETQQCDTYVPCPVDGAWSHWGQWSTCDQSCGHSGRETKTRTCSNPAPAHNGHHCVGHDTHTRLCTNTLPCPVNGAWGQWETWSKCSRSCGTSGTSGNRSRRRHCDSPAPAHGGDPCTGFNHAVTTYCPDNPTCPVDGVWGSWGSWSPCSHTCGTNAAHVKVRHCDNPAPDHGGLKCAGSGSIIEFCSLPECQVDGGLSPWGQWSSCSITCGNGTVTRDRQCNNPAPQNGGAPCPGVLTQTTSCHHLPCPVDGGLSPWGQWSSCSVTCGNGTVTRDRQCNDPTPQNGGAPCLGVLTQTNLCHHQHCPVDGGLSTWGQWSSCSVTCGNGTVTRDRQCNDPAPQNGGAPCHGVLTQTHWCHHHHCPVNGEWSTWGVWSHCSVTCGSGTASRDRTCTQPVPKNGGQDCKGNSHMQMSCNLTDCAALECAKHHGYTLVHVPETGRYLCIAVSHRRTRWDYARTHCHHSLGELVVVDGPATDNAIGHYIQGQHINNGSYLWVGRRGTAHHHGDRTWAWLQSGITYNKLNPSHIENTHHDVCLCMQWSEAHAATDWWGDRCDEYYGFVCEIKV